MKREFLEELGMEKEAIDKIMAEHGKAIQAVKPADDYEELKTKTATYEKQLSGLQETLESQKEKLSSVDELEKQVETYKLNELKTSIARQANIPYELATRLSGETEEEIKADAEKMAGFVNKQPYMPLKPTEPREIDNEDKALASMIENLDL